MNKSQPKTFRETEVLVHQAKASQPLWEEEFEKLWEQESGVAMPEITKPFKSFISSLLAHERKESYAQGFNKGANEQLKLLANKIDLEEVVGMIDGMEKELWKPLPFPKGKEGVLDKETVNIAIKNIADMRDNSYDSGYNSALSSLKQKLLDKAKIQ